MKAVEFLPAHSIVGSTVILVLCIYLACILKVFLSFLNSTSSINRQRTKTK